MQKGVLNFIVKPKNKRNESVKKIGESELILNSDLQDHRYVSRIGVIVSVPLKNETDVQVGDEVIVHHNVFRRFYDVRGNEKNSRSYFKEDCFFVSEDQIFAYKRNGEWKAIDGYCFVKPIHSEDKLNIEKEKPLTEHVYRAGSEAYFNLWAEARALYSRNLINVTGADKEILTETDLGHYVVPHTSTLPNIHRNP